MATCTSCGSDVTGKKFCQQCGTPVQALASPAATTTICPRCNEAVKPGSAFCMHCGSSLSSQAIVATAISQSLTRTCPACHAEVPKANIFCTNCGSNAQVGATPPPAAASVGSFCTSCGRQNAAGVHFCAGCGSAIGAAAPMAQTGYAQPAQYPQYAPQQPQQPQYAPQQPQYAPQYDPSQYGQSGQPQYTQYPQPQQPYGQQQYQQPPQYPQQGQAGYQQQPMVLRCPTCMAMSPLGTPSCPSCHTNLVGIVPTPAMMPNQQQQGGIGGLMQGNAGKYAMGALGGAAAVIGGEMLMHNLERGIAGDIGMGHERRRDDDDRRNDDGLLGGIGGIGNLANDIGLF